MSTEIVGAGWPAAWPALGTEKIWGEDAGGAASELPVQALRMPQVFNWDPQYLRHTQDGLARVRSGLGNMYINFVGHSAVAGYGAGTNQSGGTGTTASVNARQYGQGVLLSKALTSKGISSRAASWWGTAGLNQNTSVATLAASALAAYDPRLAFGSDWVIDSHGNGEGTLSLGGPLVQCPTSSSTAASFTPVESWDTANVYEVQVNGGGASTFNTGGSALVTNTAPTSTAVKKTTISTTAAVQTLNMLRASGGSVYPIGMEMTLSTAQQAIVRNIGQGNALAADFSDTTNVFSALNVLTSLGGDLTIIEVMRNDQSKGTSVSTWQANMQAIITAALAFGDVILVRDHEPYGNGSGGRWPLTNDAAFTAAYYSLALSNSVPLFDIPARVGTGPQALARGLFNADQIHYLGQGWQNVGGWVADKLATL